MPPSFGQTPITRSASRGVGGSSRPRVDAAQIAGLRVKRPTRALRWVAGAFVLLVTASVAYSLVNNQNIGWATVWRYLFDRAILDGLMLTLWMTAVAMAVGIVGGVLLALMRMSANPLVAWAAHTYIWFFRGTPVLVQLIFWYNLAALYPTLSLGVPFGGPVFFTGSANAIITPYVAALLGLGLNEAAYMAEIVRGGLSSVESGQIEAARALAMTYPQVMRKVVLPQAMRVIVPPTGNQVIGMLKLTSLVSVIALSDLLYSAQAIYGHNFETIPLLIVVSLWYLLLTTLLSFGQTFLERRFSKGVPGRALRAAQEVVQA
ncbi:amino acid ABC transporter permease [Mycobacterium sp. AZCC_0083]|uniref:amino acid ABC transporter permease n=1 Tax=Mycobacterium sp. AZCC_0083 TaxID=2735882 RepID=UPI001611425C|nr:amino acid ABC transporter permease [Mycobacterium sp. AZCC_0083]MBB5163225.1 polar amino acid transport system permease protein [Mycobacterium sp. AZCC_0083]